MTVTGLLRGAAILTALVGFVDPSWTARRRAPVPVDVRADAHSAAAADEVRRRLANSLSGDCEVRLGRRAGCCRAGR